MRDGKTQKTKSNPDLWSDILKKKKLQTILKMPPGRMKRIAMYLMANGIRMQIMQIERML